MVTFLIVRKGVSIWTVHLMSVSLVPMYSTAFSRSKCWRFRIDMMETERLVYLSINFISRTSEFMTIFTLSKNGLSINKIRINFLSLEVSPYTLYQAFKNGILLWQVGKIYAYRVADMNCNMFVWKKTQQVMRWKSWMMRKSKMIEINCLLNYSTRSSHKTVYKKPGKRVGSVTDSHSCSNII